MRGAACVCKWAARPAGLGVARARFNTDGRCGFFRGARVVYFFTTPTPQKIPPKMRRPNLAIQVPDAAACGHPQAAAAAAPPPAPSPGGSLVRLLDTLTPHTRRVARMPLQEVSSGGEQECVSVRWRKRGWARGGNHRILFSSLFFSAPGRV
jgi:hypothetical protein